MVSDRLWKAMVKLRRRILKKEMIFVFFSNYYNFTYENISAGELKRFKLFLTKIMPPNRVIPIEFVGSL